MNSSASRTAESPASRDVSTAIHAEGLGKQYQLYSKPIHRLWDWILPGKKRYREFWAVKNVHLDIPHGATVGIIGENGAGKSSLLKLLTGISSPTTGTVQVNGRMASMLELGAGFHPEFSGKDNIYLNCSLLGMSDEEIDERYEAIVAFSELGNFLDRPVKTYSSGMYVRLGFAVASSVDPDILLIDEALSVGDEHFKGKCVNRLNEFREQGKTTLFVSHDLGTIRTMCQTVILMDQGEIVVQGPSEKVADEYLKRVHQQGNERLMDIETRGSEYPRWGSGEIRTEEVELFAEDERRTRVFRPGEPFRVRIAYRASQDARDPVFGIGLFRADGTYVNGSNHQWRKQPIELGRVAAGEQGQVEMEFDALPLLHGRYYITVYVYDHAKAAPTAIDHREHAATFEVVDADRLQHGLLHLPTTWRVKRRATEGGADTSLQSDQ